MSVLAALLLFSLASLVYLGQASYAASASDRIKEQQTEKQRLEWERAELQRQIAELTVPAALEARAQALGYGPAQETLFVNTTARPSPSVSGPTTPIPPSAASHPATGADWWTEFQRRLAAWLDQGSAAIAQLWSGLALLTRP
jgi:cell division protein FtsB